jgi:hypothetical protein
MNGFKTIVLMVTLTLILVKGFRKRYGQAV